MKKKMMPAPIDNKNVMCDWIGEIFDNGDCTRNNNTLVGFIHEEPVIATWKDNILLWQFSIMRNIKDTLELSVLQKRLAEHHDIEGSLVEQFTIIGNLLMQQFYWKNED